MFSSSTINDIYMNYREKKLAHAYLIETNNIERATEDLKDLIKAINCEQEYQNNCSKCNLCNLINKNNLPSLKIIEPSGSNIKKVQIEELKMSFDSIPLYSKYNTYIIKNAEKLNASSANAMLKFVEEPTTGILGFFVTNNKDVIIDTIKSRCQSYSLNYEAKSLLEKFNLTNDDFEKYKRIINNYLKEIKGNNYINNKKIIMQELETKEEIIILIKIILEIYYNEFLKRNNLQYNDEVEKIYCIKDKNETIIQIIEIISRILQEMSYNVNIELLLDRFVLEMRGQNE